jgi:DNA repair exonuclease SbcCD nuclease subunit
VHTRSVLSDRPAIVYPGNPQGRHARETGPRGCYQVDVDASGRAHLEFIETDVVRWARLDMSINAHARMESLIEGLQDAARRIASRFAGPSVVRCVLSGSGPLHPDLQRDGVAEDLAYQLSSIVEVESVRVETCASIDRVRLLQTEPVVGDFLRLVDRAREDSAFREHLADSLTPLFRRRELTPPDPARLLEWIEKAGGLGVDLLLDVDR